MCLSEDMEQMPPLGGHRTHVLRKKNTLSYSASMLGIALFNTRLE